MSSKNILVTGGDVQIFAAILNGVIIAHTEIATEADIVTSAFEYFDEYKRQHAEREDEKKAGARAAFKGECDEKHGGGPCRDPECWQR